MEILQKFVQLLSKIPDWVLLYVLPALLVVAAVGCVFVQRRRWYLCPATVLTAAGFTVAYAKDASLAFVYAGVCTSLAALLALLFLIPRPAKRERGIKKSRLDTMYEKFHEELSEKPYTPRVKPPKECCFEGERVDATAKECGVSLTYADSLLVKLRTRELPAGDRLEIEELARRLDDYRDRPLSEAEQSSLNDCLASILKLTAKYQL